MTNDLLSTTEAARYLGLTRQRVDQLIREGSLTATKIAGRRLLSRHSIEILVTQRAQINNAWRPRNLRELRLKAKDIKRLAKGRHLSQVRVFGSVVDETTHEQSDVDLIVYRPLTTSVIDLTGFAYEVEQLLGCKVDVITDDNSKSALFQEILESAVPL